MRKVSAILVVILLISSCSGPLKPKDFVGSYYFLKPKLTKDENQFANPTFGGLSLVSFPMIQYYEVYPIALELFLSEDQLNGKITFYQSGKQKKTGQRDYNLSRFRISGDTLRFEVEVGSLSNSSLTTMLIRSNGHNILGLSVDPVSDEDLDEVSKLTGFAGISDGFNFMESVNRAEADSIIFKFFDNQIESRKLKGLTEDSPNVKYLRARQTK